MAIPYEAASCPQASTAETARLRTDEILQRLASSRDPDAWAALLQYHGSEIMRACRRILHDESLAEDAVQETLLLIRDRAGQFRNSGSDSARAAGDWVRRTACTTALQMLRSRSRERRRDMRRATEFEVEKRTAQSEAIKMDNGFERAEAVRLELDRMPSHDRLPVLLHYYGEMGYEQIAEVLNCPIGTAKTRVYRGVEKLRKRMALLGLIYAFGQLSSLLERSSAQAAEAEGACDANKMEEWQSLLRSARKPSVLEFKPPRGGVSAMIKIGIFTAALLIAVLLTLVVGPTSGSDDSLNTLTDSPNSPALSPNNLGNGTNAAARRDLTESAPTSPLNGSEGPLTEEERKILAEGNNAFALDFFGKLKATHTGNLFFSPYSISSALALTYAGAKGNTEIEMAKALHFPLAQERLHTAMGTFISDLNTETKEAKPRGFQLSVANSLWGQKGYPFKPDFLSLTKDRYGAGLTEVDFLNATEDARVAINKWVEQKTKERIKDVISQGALTPNSKLVLVNAIYFKGAWQSSFPKNQTKAQPFHLTAAKQASIPMMNQNGPFRYMEEENKFQLLELPYVKSELSMLVFLPATLDGLSSFEDSVTLPNLAKWTAALRSEQVAITLPKFTMTWGTEDLKDALKSMGIKDAFTDQAADFSGMSDSKGLYIAFIMHKAFIDVNEEGTEAAAATAVGASTGPQPRRVKPIVFCAERPFVFAIRDNASGSILFMGRVADPKQN